MSSRSVSDNLPTLPSSLIVVSPSKCMVVARPPSIRCRVVLVGSSTLLFGDTEPSIWALLLPPYGSPGIPSQ